MYTNTYNAATYFSSIAENLKDIADSSAGNHFTSISGIHQMEGFLAERQNLQGYQLVYVDWLKGRIIDNKSDNIINHRFHSFFILKNAPDATYSSKGTAAINGCRQIAEKVISKMRYDRRNYDALMERLDISSINYEQVETVGQGWHGVSVGFFIFDNPGKIVYNADDWN